MTTTQEQPRVSDPEPRPRPAEGPAGGAFARWLAGWRVSLRMARRDIRRHRGRSLIVAVMVGLPVLILVGGLTGLETRNITVREALPATMGSAQALLGGSKADYAVSGDPWSIATVVQCENGSAAALFPGSWGVDGPPLNCGDGTPTPRRAEPIPGLTPDAALASAMTAIQGVTGGRLVPLSSQTTDVEIDRRLTPIQVLAVDGTDPAVRGMVELVDGRWPTRPGEYVVTDWGQRLGLPASGTLDLSAPISSGQPTPTATAGQTSAPTRTASPAPEPTPTATPATPTMVAPPPIEATPRVTGTVVGTARAAAATQPIALVTAAPTTLQGTQFLLTDTAPITWQRVQELNNYGLALLSRDVVENPSQVPADQPTQQFGPPAIDLIALVLLCLALLIESCLLAGPAFAVIAQRQRRSLALAAANGATRAQLRRTLLAQALVLGFGATIVGLVAGVALAALALPILARLRPMVLGPFEVPALQTSIVVVFAIVAAVVSALIPARGLTRLDVVAALRGDVLSPAPHRGLPVVGIALFVAGTVVMGATVLNAFQLRDPNATLLVLLIFLSGAAVVIGALLLVGSLLALLGRLSRGMPLVVRMATRDASRQRGRAVPTVAAIMAGAILLAGFGIGGLTADESMRRDYRPQAPEGMARLYAGVGNLSPEQLTETVQQTIPGARVLALGRPILGSEQPQPGDGGVWSGGTTPAFVAATGCTPAQALNLRLRPPAIEDRCASVVINDNYGGNTVVMSAEDLTEIYGLPSQAQETLRRGGLVTNTPGLVADGSLTFVEGQIDQDPETYEPTWHSAPGRVEVPAMTQQFQSVLTGNDHEVLMTPLTAARLGAQAEVVTFFVAEPSGTITAEQQAALAAALGLASSAEVPVERGYQSTIQAWLFVAFLSVALLTLVATLTATALSMGESRRDLATLAAVGASDGIRRRLAAVQAGMLASIGTVLGLAVGAVPGVIFAWVMTRAPDPTGSHLEWGYAIVPWWTFAAALVIVPLLAAGLAALFVRGRPDLTRRLA